MAKGKKKSTKKSKKTTEKKETTAAAPPVEEAPEATSPGNDAWEPESVFSGEPTSAEPLGVEETLRAQVEAYRNQLARMGADFANFRRRSGEERSKTLLYANESLVNALLPVLDDFDRGIGHMEAETQDPSEVFDGVRLIWRRLLKILESIGVAPFESVGEHFDPLMHEAVQIMDQEGLPGGTIVQELEKGFKYHDRLLRAARVVVTPLNKKAAAAPPEPEEEPEPERAPTVMEGAEQPETEDVEGAQAAQEPEEDETPIVSEADGFQDSPWRDADEVEAEQVEEEEGGEEQEEEAEILAEEDDDEEFEVIPEDEDAPAEPEGARPVPVVRIDENLLQQNFELDEASFEEGVGPDSPSDSPDDSQDDDLDFMDEETKPELDIPEDDD